MSVTGGGQNLGTATFYIVGDATGAHNAAQQANRALASLSKNVQQNTFGLNQLAIAFSALPAAAAGGLAVAVKSTIELQDAFFRLGVATNETGVKQEQLQQKLLALGRITPVATVELIKLASAGAQLGVLNENLDTFARTMSIFTTATDAGAASVSDMARIMNVFRVPEEEMESLTNTVIELGRSTAAASPELLNVTKRISGAANAAGISAQQALALGTALVSLGPRAEAGATALNKTMNDMVRSIGTASDEMQIFADIMTRGDVEEFARIFREDAAEAVALFATELGKLDAIGQVTVLDKLGISEARQVMSLQALAAGTRDYGNIQRDVNAILDAATGKFADSTAVQDALDAKMKTLGGQLVVLKNIIQQFGASIGDVAAGPLGMMVKVFGDMLSGFMLLPDPIKLTTFALIGLLAILSSVAATAILLGTRIILVRAALQSLTTSTGQASSTTAQLGGAAIRAAGGMTTFAVATDHANRAARAFHANIIPLMLSMSGFGAQANSMLAPMGAATVATNRWSGALRTLGKGFGVLGLAMTGLSIASVVLGNRQRKLAEEAHKAQQPIQSLVDAMRSSGSATSEAAFNALKLLPAFNAVRQLSRQLGIDLVILQGIIAGTVTSGPAFEDFKAKIAKADGQVKKNIITMAQLAKAYQASAGKAGVATRATGGFSDSQSKLAEDIEKANRALQKQHDLMSQVAQAYVDLVGALRQQERASRELSDAQKDYAKVLDEAGTHADQLAAAELRLADAQSDHQAAQRRLIDLTKELGRVRQDQANKARDAELDLSDARDRVIDTSEKVRDIEEQIAKLRSGPSTEELAKATNKLRDAQLSLNASTRTVADAEFRLQQLREDGASKRDIEEAEQQLAEAQLAVAKNQSDIIDATDELNELRDESLRAKKLVDLERDLQKAHRNSERSIRDVGRQERDLADLRSDIASDKAYLDKQQEIIDAQLNVRDATNRVREAERELNNVRAGLPLDVVVAAQERLEDAIYRLAEANVEVRKQQALANGEMWDAGRAARALANELEHLIGLSPTAQSVQELRNFIDTLRNAPNVPPAPDMDSGGGGAGGGGLGDDFFGDEDIFGEQGEDAAEDWADGFVNALTGINWGSVWNTILNSLSNFFTSTLPNFFRSTIPMLAYEAGRLFGSLLGAAIKGVVNLGEAAVNAISSFISGLTLEGIIQWFTELPGHILDILGTPYEWLIHVAKNILIGFLDGLDEQFPGIKQWFLDLPKNIIRWVKDLFGISSPSTVFAEIGADLLRGFLQGLGNMIGEIAGWFLSLPGKVLGWLGDMFSLLIGKGGDILRGLLSGAWSMVGDLINFFWELPGKLVSAMGNVWDTFTGIGKDIVNGVVNGIQSAPGKIKDALGSAVGGAINGAKNLLGIGSPSKVFVDIGNSMVNGLVKGVDEKRKNAGQSMDDLVRAVTVDDQSKIGKALIDSIIDGMEDQFNALEKTLMDVSGMIHSSLADDYLAGLMGDIDSFRAKFAGSGAGLFGMAKAVTKESGGNTEVLQLQALTNADPQQIMNAYTWAKRVRLRGGNG